MTPSEKYNRWRRVLPQSYILDYMIIQLYNYHFEPETTDERRNDLEEAIRVINQESRTNRIELRCILDNTIQRASSARIPKPLKDAKHCYILCHSHPKNEKARKKG